MNGTNRLFAWIVRLRSTAEVKKAMEKYREANPRCEWDGCSTDCHVHHIIPVHVRPDLSGDINNMITLGASRCHLVVGHAGNWGNRHVENVRELCHQAQINRHLPPTGVGSNKVRPEVATSAFNASHEGTIWF
jgi:hypothetical protein